MFGYPPRSIPSSSGWRTATANHSPDAFIFPSARGTPINTNNFLFRVLKQAGEKAGIERLTHQMLRRTCSTYMAQLTTVKDVQAHLRHSTPKTTLEHYPGTLHQVGSGDCSCRGRISGSAAEGDSDRAGQADKLNPIEPNLLVPILLNH